jgi:transcriptional regulator with XRE-family HTH domain
MGCVRLNRAGGGNHPARLHVEWQRDSAAWDVARHETECARAAVGGALARRLGAPAPRRRMPLEEDCGRPGKESGGAALCPLRLIFMAWPPTVVGSAVSRCSVTGDESLIETLMGAFFDTSRHVAVTLHNGSGTVAPGISDRLEGSGRVSGYGSPTVRRRRLAAELRRLRDGAGLTADQAAQHLGWSPSKVSRYELARTGLKSAEVRKMLDLYAVDGPPREELLALAREATEKGWWEAYSDTLPADYAAYIGLEAEARSCLEWQAEVIPGLLQTEAYAMQIHKGQQRVATIPPSQIERRVEVRLVRQQLLTRDPPLELQVVLDESVLLRRVADNPVMHAQLERLVEVSRLPNVTLRVLPLDGHHPILTTSFAVLRFGEADGATGAKLRDVVSTEHLSSGELHFEGETDTYQYGLAFASLAEESLSASLSRELISSTARRLWT